MAGYVGRVFGLRTAMTLSTMVYTLWVFVNILGPFYVRLPVSCLLGVASAVLWVHQGVWLARVSENAELALRKLNMLSHDSVTVRSSSSITPPTPSADADAIVGDKSTAEKTAGKKDADIVGVLNGIFFSLFALNGAVGNIVALTLLNEGVSVTDVLWVLVGISAAACVFVALQVRVKSLKPKVTAPSLSAQLSQFRDVLLEKRTLLLLPYMLALGISRSFIFTYLGLLSGVSLLPYCFLAYSVACSISNVSWGGLYDRYGWPPLVLGQLVGFLAMLCSFAIAAELNMSVLFVSAGAWYGISDSSSSAVLALAIMKHYTSNISTAFSIYNFAFSFGAAVGFGVSAAFPSNYYPLFALTSVIEVVAVPCYLYMEWAVLPASSGVVSTPADASSVCRTKAWDVEEAHQITVETNAATGMRSLPRSSSMDITTAASMYGEVYDLAGDGRYASDDLDQAVSVHVPPAK